jgi:hypothetical protein
VDGEVLHFIAIRGNGAWIGQKCNKKKLIFFFIFEFFLKLWNPSYACQHNLIWSLKSTTSIYSILQKIKFKLG